MISFVVDKQIMTFPLACVDDDSGCKDWKSYCQSNAHVKDHCKKAADIVLPVLTMLKTMVCENFIFIILEAVVVQNYLQNE